MTQQRSSHLSTPTSIGLHAKEVFTETFGDDVAPFVLESECATLGYDLNSLSKEEFDHLVAHIEGVMVSVIGPHWAQELARNLKAIPCTGL